ncbi:MBL fold metallo-hydrolase [Brevibacillus dissolubilis]|uniref:MBL fold metallo-hydrolase n=1 Tax=Brevibacillus dissolubilis TaxID=1844116 RepID=UPI001116B335|nr:MBL fold metallo-hydrolase [Brevibacillus dissolubilis]
MNLQLTRLTDHILYLPPDGSVDRPVLAMISGCERSLIMDAGNSSAHAALFLEQVSEHELPPAELVALTHWHWDHVFGMDRLNLPSIAHVETRRQLEIMQAWEWTDEAIDERVKQGIEIPFCAEYIKKEFAGRDRDIKIKLPTILFEEKLKIDLGGITVTIEHVGGDHAHDSCLIYVKEDKVLFLGDAIGPAIYCPNRYYTDEQLLPLLDRIEAYDAEYFVTSHGGPLTKSEMQFELEIFRGVACSTREHRGDRDKIAHDLARLMKLAECPEDELKWIDCFIEGYHLAAKAE